MATTAATVTPTAGDKQAPVKTVKKATKTAPKKGKKTTLKFIIDSTIPVEHGIMDPGSFEKFLHDRIKVNGKAGVLGHAVIISRDKTKIHITAEQPFSKRYLKYLTKKYLKKQQLRDWLHVISTNKTTYELRYFNIHDQDDDSEDDPFDDEEYNFDLLRKNANRDPDGNVSKNATKNRVKEFLIANGNRNTNGTLDARMLTFAIDHDDPGPDDNEGEQYAQEDSVKHNANIELPTIIASNPIPPPAFQADKVNKQNSLQVSNNNDDVGDVEVPNSQKLQKARASALDI